MFVISKQQELVFKINFLVDIGAPTTLLSWNEVPYRHFRQIYAKRQCIPQWVAALERSFRQNAVYFFTQILVYII